MTVFRLTSFYEEIKKDWRKQISAVFLLLVLLSIVLPSMHRVAPEKAPQKEAIFLDQMLPPGQRMAPLQAQNIASLERIMGQTAVVTLFNSETNALIASGIKVVRAPQSPETIMYVSPIEVSQKISMMGEKLIAVLQNPNSEVGSDFVKKKDKPQRIIILN